MAKVTDTRIRCSFCGKAQDQVQKLIAGPNGAYICNECIAICADIIDEDAEEEVDEESFARAALKLAGNESGQDAGDDADDCCLHGLKGVS